MASCAVGVWALHFLMAAESSPPEPSGGIVSSLPTTPESAAGDSAEKPAAPPVGGSPAPAPAPDVQAELPPADSKETKPDGATHAKRNPPAPLASLSPVDDFAAGEALADEAAVAAGEEVLAPVPPDGPDWVMSAPDGMLPAADNPLAATLADGFAEASAPPAPQGSDPADLVAADSAPPADGRSAPWVAASGGYTGYSPAGSVPMIAAPSGFSNAPPAFPTGGPGDGILDGFSLAATLAGTYDSNPSQGYAGPENSGQSDYFLTLGGGLDYRSKASEWTFGATYSGSYSQYLEQSELSGYDQSAGASVAYHGGPLAASLSLGIGFGSGANRYYASVVDEITYNYRLAARYKLSARTSLTGDLSQNLTSSSGANNGVSTDQSSLDFGVAALWRYSALTEFGPGIRYTVDGGDSQLGRSSIGPTLTVNYKLSRKVSMDSRVGVDFPQYDGGGSADPMLSMSAGLNYQASRLWGVSLSLYRDAQSDFSTAGAFTTVTSLRLGYHHKIRRASLNLGLGFETNASENSDGVSAGNRPDRDYLTLDGSLGMPILSNTTMASLFLRYQDQGGGGTDSWDSTQTGFRLSRSF